MSSSWRMATLKLWCPDRSVQDTLQTQLVPLQRGDRLPESLLGAAGGAAVDTGHVHLLPVNGDIVGLENGLDGLGDFGTDTVTGNEGDGVFASVLGGLEDVGLDGREGSRGSSELWLLGSPYEPLLSQCHGKPPVQRKPELIQLKRK